MKLVDVDVMELRAQADMPLCPHLTITLITQYTLISNYYVTGLILRKILDCTGGDIYGERGRRGARVYNGNLGAEPPAGSRGRAKANDLEYIMSLGRAPGQGARGRSP